MPRFAANLTYLFTEVPALARADLAQEAGFDAVEVLFPYDHPTREWKSALGALPLALINTPPGDWAMGDRGHAAVPDAQETFRTSFLRAADVATQLGAHRIHVMAGVARGELAEAIYRENLQWALDQAPEAVLTIEPLNSDDMPGYFLNDFDQAARIVDDIASPRLGIQFDLWHAARIHGDADAVWAKHKDRVNHIQIAGFPNRNEPGGGGFDLTGLCAALDDSDWPGFVAAEYIPSRATVHGLMWLSVLKRRSQPIGA